MRARTPQEQAWLPFVNKIADAEAGTDYGNHADTAPEDVKNDMKALRGACQWAARTRGLDSAELFKLVKMKLKDVKEMKLTGSMLRRMVAEEMRRSRGTQAESVKPVARAKEVDADEYAESLEKHVDHAKALKTEEARLIRRVKRLREQRNAIVKRMLSV